MPVNLDDYISKDENAWCPGCGNFPILNAVKRALVDLQLEPFQVLIVSGIGQASKLPHYLKCNTFNGLHGRTLPVATGAKLANHDLTVLAISGDGDGYGEGGNHFIHAMRRNPDITYIVHNNQVYGLTKGQASPTSDYGFVTKTTPFGSIEPAENPIALAIASDCPFVARGFAGDIDHLTSIIVEAIRHRGFSLVDVLQPCVTFNKKNTYQWYRERVYKVNEDKDYNPWDKISAFKKGQEWGERIPVGIIFRVERKTLIEQLPAIKETPLVAQRIDSTSFSRLLEEFY
jgi:2-oxoglutarate ferredoxin oxidoreductase subunit beta